MAGRGLSIRPFSSKDLDRVCQLEEAVFAMPWSRDSFESELEDDGIAFSWVAERGGRLLAYLIAWLVEDELHIGNIAVDPDHRRQGIGRSLLAYCLARAAERGVIRATLEVRESNSTAITLYEESGFRPVAIRKRYYCDNGEDAVVMLKAFPSVKRGA
ncbi:MAG: ribosomal protein S18-alanine N-acetyltransferase [Candidatus Eisenbacteria bacterium]|nr:ribosomal protein S18-alanine N-acetyltransferase [Candidatus Eisenbacteria bacterium]